MITIAKKQNKTKTKKYLYFIQRIETLHSAHLKKCILLLLLSVSEGQYLICFFFKFHYLIYQEERKYLYLK